MQSERSNLAARRYLTLGVAALLLSTQAVFGQTTTTTTDQSSTSGNDQVVKMEEFTVTSGFASSLAASAAAKEAAPTITEVISSEDIGKLPDTSIADSLVRLTGITTQRANGRSQGISIRGLTGDFSTGMLNGREQVSTGENRAVEFDQYPAELLDQVIVYKTAAADLTGQGLAGTVDMRTVQPLSKPGRTIAANAWYDWTQYHELTPGAKSKGNRFTFSYVDQFDDHKLGIAIGYSHSSKPFEGEQFQAWGYPTDASGNFVLGGTKSYVRSSNLDRDGLMAIVEYKPNDNIHSTVDVYTSKFKEKQLLRGLEIPLWWSGAHFQPGYTISNGLATDGTYTNVQPVVRNDLAQRDDKPFAIGWNLKLGEKSDWPVTFDAGYSRVSRTDEYLETWSGLGFAGGATNPDTVRVQLIPGHIPVLTPTVNYSDPTMFRLTDPQGWQTWMSPIGGPGWLKYIKSKDELGQLKLSTDHALQGFMHDLELGVSYSDRYKRDGEGPSGLPVNANGQALAPLPPIIGHTDLSYLGGGLGSIYAYDPEAALANGFFKFVPDPSPDFVARRFEIEEKITQPYAQLNLKGNVGVPVTGDIGLRAIGVDQTSKGYSANGTTVTPVSDGDKYWDFAPDLNLNFKVTPDTLIRFSVARQVARPRMYDMRAGRNWGYDPTLASSTDLSHSPWSAGEAGNPHLRPWKADSIDLSLEKYFSQNRGYFALALFQKKLLSYIYTQSQLADFTGYPYKGSVAPVLRQGVASQPVNGSGGRISGAEASLTLTSELINQNIRGFGVQMGGAYTDSSVKPWGPGNGDAPIAGLSRKVANITLYYERHGFSARVSERYRSSTREYIYTFGVPQRGGDVSPGSGYTVALPERVIDAQVSYTLQSTSLKGLTFYLQAYNLNDEPLVTYNNGDPRQVINYQKYGASYSAGVSYKF